ncbi:hypothetical protein Mag101_03405 [Microbulbifer agarilyticus]|uniref:Adenosine deaminase n=1 Tax=Microbulbifer agarilyticus TaxID=260552 RepID=A0A1Q2M249_9GAMM|nr:class I SAM-dependent methyltransferase [Microbulbifer agarilyticus]AQQ66793.1 hypothetical protein Mag101_03405 [Microbulbifer agarilyticus]
MFTDGNNNLEDTAFLWNCFRESNITLSRDHFASLWVTDSVRATTRQHCDDTLPSEPFVHCLRHRLFLDLLSGFSTQHPQGVFVNLGAGFTNYPYLLPTPIATCEVDQRFMGEYKQKKLQELEDSGALPKRDITFIASDLAVPQAIQKLTAQLDQWIAGRPSFILMEGLLYYLPQPAVNTLFKGLGEIQKKGDTLAAMSFRPEESRKAAYRDLAIYFQRQFNNPNFQPTALPRSFYENLPHYQLTAHYNYFELAKHYTPDHDLGRSESVLEEDSYILLHK